MAKRSTSRPARWAEACRHATDSLEELVELQEEYGEWLDNLPEGLDQSNVAEKLEAVRDLDLETARETVSEADNTELPLGFGRD